jgi:hypothetical protein
MRHSDSDWEEARKMMAEAVRHGSVAGGFRFLLRLFREDPQRYRAMHAEEKAKAVRELNPLSGGRRDE